MAHTVMDMKLPMAHLKLKPNIQQVKYKANMVMLMIKAKCAKLSMGQVQNGALNQ
uniref:CSON010008 protein n=1 Tax=Culicoides sonorensis TaxID=179676 RepID=A0A336LEZ1_CULSO